MREQAIVIREDDLSGEKVRALLAFHLAGMHASSPPGHVFPLIVRSGGVLERAAAAEAAIDLCRLAGTGDAAVLCSIMRSDGSMARIEDMDDFAREHEIPVLDLRDVVRTLERKNEKQSNPVP